MTGTKSPVPRLDKLPTLMPQQPSRSSIGSGNQSFTSLSSASDSESHEKEHRKPGRKAGKALRADRPTTASLIHEHTQHRGRPPPSNPSSLAPLSAILSSNSQGASSKKASSQSSRLKEILRERAVSRGISRLGAHEAASLSSSPEPQVAASRLDPQTDTAAVSPSTQAEISPALSPEGSTASLPGTLPLVPTLPLISDEDIQRAVRYFAGERDADSFTDEKLLEKCGPFYPGLTLKDARLLVGHGSMSGDKLRKVVRIALHKDLGDFDPIAEAFKVLDPRSTGHADMDVLADMLSHIAGLKTLSAEDREFLLKISDLDQDGFMSEADFRRCSTFLPATRFDQLTAP